MILVSEFNKVMKIYRKKASLQPKDERIGEQYAQTVLEYKEPLIKETINEKVMDNVIKCTFNCNQHFTQIAINGFILLSILQI